MQNGHVKVRERIKHQNGHKCIISPHTYTTGQHTDKHLHPCRDLGPFPAYQWVPGPAVGSGHQTPHRRSLWTDRQAGRWRNGLPAVTQGSRTAARAGGQTPWSPTGLEERSRADERYHAVKNMSSTLSLPLHFTRRSRIMASVVRLRPCCGTMRKSPSALANAL